MSKPISVIISSLRPERLEKTIDNIATERDWVEVVVVSPQPPRPRDFVKHVPVAAPGDPNEMSFTQKYNLGVEHAGGTYIINDNDDIHFLYPGWAQKLIRFMEAHPHRPFLACFHGGINKQVTARHTLFGLLYSNHGCIRKADLPLIGGKLFDDRLYMYYCDGDLGVRVWAAGGEVAVCDEVTMNCDDDDLMPISRKSVFAAKAGNLKTYREIWFEHDAEVFYQKWFWQYFPMLFARYPKIAALWTNADHVLAPPQYAWGRWRIFAPQFLQLLFYKLTFNQPQQRRIKEQLCRFVNRRWHQLQYALPYQRQEIQRRLP